jgi:dihydrodipicolinate synthase/N-acetylneuraminate lyase
MGEHLQKMAESAKVSRPMYEYTIPESMGGKVKSVTLIELTAHEELQATKRAGSANDAMFKLAYELAKQALVEVNGEKVGLADGSVDTAFNSMSPGVRNLVLQAYAELHSPPEGAAEGFKASRKVRVA